jgi:hypothetical protein
MNSKSIWSSIVIVYVLAMQTQTLQPPTLMVYWNIQR